MHTPSEKGQSMVEFALVLPILVLLLCGICEIGSVFSHQILANNACREAARYVAIHYKDDGLASVEEKANIIAENYSSNFEVQITMPSTEEIKVYLTGEVQLLTPFFVFLDDGSGSVTLTSQCKMRME